MITIGTESTTGLDRTSLLIAMVSGDVIVLAKLVRTLCPRKLLVYGTAHARRRGWTTSATRLLESLSRSRPEIVERFEVIDLPQTGLRDRLDGFRQMLEVETSRIQVAGATIAFDCTTGQNIFHVLGFEVLQRLGAERGADVSVVYLDADSRSVVRATTRDGLIHCDQEPTKFRFRAGTELSERFGMYGVEPRVQHQLWPSANDPARQVLLCRLYDALCERADLRALFQSNQWRLKRWKQRRTMAAGDASRADIGVLARRAIDDIAGWVGGQTGQDSHRALVGEGLARLLESLAPPGDAAAWLDYYLRDRRLAEVRRRLNLYGQRLPVELLRGARVGARSECKTMPSGGII